MSSSSGGGTRSSSSSNASAAAATSGSSKRSSPLNYFSLDIPASLLGSSSASASSPGATSSNSSLPHQSCSLPFVARLVRTPSSSSSTSGHGAGDSPHQDHQHHFQQVKDIKKGRWLPISIQKMGEALLVDGGASVILVGWPFVATRPDGIRSRHGYSSFLSVNVAAAVAVFFQASAAAAVFVYVHRTRFSHPPSFKEKQIIAPCWAGGNL